MPHCELLQPEWFSALGAARGLEACTKEAQEMPFVRRRLAKEVPVPWTIGADVARLFITLSPAYKPISPAGVGAPVHG